MNRYVVEITVDGTPVEARTFPNQTLLEVLRTELGHTEVKYGCGEGVCGTCTVLLDGQPVSSCLVFAVQADGHVVATPRGRPDDRSFQQLREDFLTHGAAQCGFCTPGMLLVAHHLISENRAPTRAEIREGLSGNLCRCTGYTKIIDAVEQSAAAAHGEPT